MTEEEKYLERIPMWASKKNSLSDIRKFLGRMGNPDRHMNIIHVAGTNGKGSVCAYLTSVLNQAGYDTAAFVSPHLICVRERFLHGSEAAKERDFVRAFAKVRKLARVMEAEGYARPTYFEFLFYMFMDMADGWRPDFVILETGMGGLLDTTNVIEGPILTVVTSISMDHMQYLGNTLEEIAAQKAGILKGGVPVVWDDTCPESSRVIRRTAEILGCPMYPVSGENLQLLGREKGMIRAALKWEDGVRTMEIGSYADYQMINAGLAVRAVQVMEKDRHLTISGNAVEEGIRTSFWPGRMEEILPEVFLDGAHNEGGVRALADTIARMQREDKRPAVLMFGAAGDKEYVRMIGILCGRVNVSRVIATGMHTGRSADAASLEAEFRRKLSCPVEGFATVREAWNRLMETKGNGPAFIAGSLYLAGEVKELLEIERQGICQEEKESEET